MKGAINDERNCSDELYFVRGPQEVMPKSSLPANNSMTYLLNLLAPNKLTPSSIIKAVAGADASTVLVPVDGIEVTDTASIKLPTVDVAGTTDVKVNVVLVSVAVNTLL